MSTELADLLRRRIALAGPISVAEFMVEALAHPTLGYYRRARAIGAEGDFVTAPEISQMFGELVGAWLAERWIAAGRPDPVRLVELGPGRGTLLTDALRATRSVQGFHAALHLHLVEIDATLAAQQRAALAGVPIPAQWHERFDDVPDDAPLLLVANEFFDALPIRQLVRSGSGWRERMIGLARGADPAAAGATSDACAAVPAASAAVGGIDGEIDFAFAIAPGPSPLAMLLDSRVGNEAPVGTVAEVSPASLSLMHAIAGRLARTRGAALIVDYGHAGVAHGDTLQAVYRHAKTGIFNRIGASDMTAHVDFAALARTAREAGARVDGPVGQGDFLRTLGIATRARALLARASDTQASDIRDAMARLIDPGQMGTLFHALAIRDPLLPPAPGFTPPEPDTRPIPGPDQ